MEKKTMKNNTLIKAAFFIFLAGLFVITGCSDKDDEVISLADNGSDEEILLLVEEAYDDYIVKYPGFPGGFAVYVIYGDHKFLAHKGVGASLTDSHHFRAQSTTKTFTATGIMLLQQRGLLNINHGVVDTIPGMGIPYLPATNAYDIPYKDKITIWQLLNHTAGVFDLVNSDEGEGFLDALFQINPDSTVTIDVMTSFIAGNQLYHFFPGTSWHYSNSGYQLLVKIIERVSGKTYRQFMRDEFIIPLALNETSFPDRGDEQTLPAPYVDTWFWGLGMTINQTEQNMSANVGEGNMISSARDLGRFYHLLLQGKAGVSMLNVSAYMLNFVPTSPTSSTSYGAGLYHYKNLGYGHGGDGSGFTIRCFTDPDKDFTILAFFNCWNYKDGPGDLSYFKDQQFILLNMLYEVKEIVTTGK